MKHVYARLNEYGRLLSELNEHYDEDLDRVVVFRYSQELIKAMNDLRVRTHRSGTSRNRAETLF